MKYGFRRKIFWDYPPANLGSSRHIIIQNIQLKGSGRNPMASEQIRFMRGEEVIFGKILRPFVSHLYKGALPLGLQEGLECFSPMKKEFLEHKTEPFRYNSTLIREAVFQVNTSDDWF